MRMGSWEGVGNRVCPQPGRCHSTANRNHVRGSSTVLSSSVAASSLRPHGQSPARLPSSCDFPGKKTGVGCHFQLQRLFPAQGSNPGLLHCRWILYHLNHQGSRNRCPGKANIAVYLPKTRRISLSPREGEVLPAGCFIHFCCKYFMGPSAPETPEEMRGVSSSAAWTSFQSRTWPLPLKSEYVLSSRSWLSGFCVFK